MLQNVSGKKEEVKREKLACASAPPLGGGVEGGVVLHNCLGACYLFLTQGTSCGFSQEVWRYYYLILMFCQLLFQKVRSFSRREGNFGLWLSVGLQQLGGMELCNWNKYILCASWVLALIYAIYFALQAFPLHVIISPSTILPPILPTILL